jgi:hypothetical protein
MSPVARGHADRRTVAVVQWGDGPMVGSFAKPKPRQPAVSRGDGTGRRWEDDGVLHNCINCVQQLCVPVVRSPE